MQKFLQNKIKGDIVIWGIVILLSLISTLAVYSATSSLAYRQMQGNTEYYLLKHLFLVIMSILAMWLIHNLDYRYFSGLSKIGLWISIPLLLFTWKHGSNINEASRWITIPLINKTFQPSDLAQFTLIIYLANILSKKQNKILSLYETFIPIAGWSTLICGLIALTNLSTAILIFVTCLILMFIARIPLKFISAYVLVGFIVVIFALGIGQRGSTAINRIKSYIKGEISFQTKQSYIAIASGGLYGNGPGKSIQRNFLPHPYSDFIYAVLIEEYGLLGACFILFLYLLLLYRSISIINETKNIFGILLTVGLSLLLVLQAIINMSVVVGLVPVTGLTLPFVSMGGTSLLFTGMTIGAIISVSRGEIDYNIKLKNNKKGYNL
ncbi:MAG: FtsW/RodA/SpoVE family cell cycle protein [Bacteroidetes bacterium]|nr:FtsW/RodA/SpoVE family cell cycle protein [Bacteroidota bacterium]